MKFNLVRGGQTGNSRQYINPDVVPLLTWRGEFHLPEWCRYHYAVLVETGREWIRIEHGADPFDVCYTTGALDPKTR